MRLRLLDLFCGMGGWSEGFHAEGFYCLGVDVVDVGYPYDLILQDVRTINGKMFRGFDVIVGSPPCRDFSQITSIGRKKWKNPPNPQKGLELVYAFLRIVKEARPRFWVMENVVGLCKYLDLKPKVVTYISPTRKRAFWGNFPPFLIPCVNTPKVQDVKGKFRSWLRAKIPFHVSRAFARAIKKLLEGRWFYGGV